MMEFIWNVYMLPFWIFKFLFPGLLWVTLLGLAGLYLEEKWRNK